MTFAQAIHILNAGERIRRTDWDERAYLKFDEYDCYHLSLFQVRDNGVTRVAPYILTGDDCDSEWLLVETKHARVG